MAKSSRFFLIFILFNSVNVAATNYRFAVKVANNTYKVIESVEVRWITRYENNAWPCWVRTEMAAGTSYEDKCFPTTVQNQNWERRIKVKFNCQNQSEKTIYFPKGESWFDLNHSKMNGDRYSVKVRLTDC